MSVKVDLKDPATQLRLKKAGIRWRMGDYERGYLELDDKTVERLGIPSVKGKTPAPIKVAPTSGFTPTQPPAPAEAPAAPLQTPDPLGATPAVSHVSRRS